MPDCKGNRSRCGPHRRALIRDGGNHRRIVHRIYREHETAGTLDPAFTASIGNDDLLGSFAVQPDGRIIFGGLLSTVNGVPVPNLVRLFPAGSLDTIFKANLGSGPNDIAGVVAVQADGHILVGGRFTSVNGQPRGRIARLFQDGTLESTATFNPGTGANNHVNSIAVQQDGKILITGEFTEVNGQPRVGIVRLLPDGSVEV